MITPKRKDECSGVDPWVKVDTVCESEVWSLVKFLTMLFVLSFFLSFQRRQKGRTKLSQDLT